MRCANCGWDNPSKNSKCEKCGAPIINSNDSDDLSSDRTSQKRFDPKKTAEGCPECGYPVRLGETACPNCGHLFDMGEPEEPVPVKAPKPAKPFAPATHDPAVKTCHACHATVSATARFCPNCGTSLSDGEKSVAGTVLPWKETAQSSGCTLTLIAREGEESGKEPLQFSGDTVELNRDNTEPGNLTITSKVQAELSFENGKWYIQDKSDLKTSYIHAGDRTELKPGGTILLGNRSFLFHA